MLIGVEAVPQQIPGGVEAKVSLIEVAYRRVRSVQTSQHVTARDGRSEVTRGSVKIELEVALGNLGDSIELAPESRRDYGNPDTARDKADALADAISARL